MSWAAFARVALVETVSDSVAATCPAVHSAPPAIGGHDVEVGNNAYRAFCLAAADHHGVYAVGGHDRSDVSERSVDRASQNAVMHAVADTDMR